MGGSKPGGPQSKKLPKRGPGRPKGLPNIATREHKAFCKEFLESPEYRKSAMARMLEGKAPHLESLALGYAYGQPKRELEITTKRPTTFVLSVDEESASGQPGQPGSP